MWTWLRAALALLPAFLVVVSCGAFDAGDDVPPALAEIP